MTQYRLGKVKRNLIVITVLGILITTLVGIGRHQGWRTFSTVPYDEWLPTQMLIDPDRTISFTFPNSRLDIPRRYFATSDVEKPFLLRITGLVPGEAAHNDTHTCYMQNNGVLSCLYHAISADPCAAQEDERHLELGDELFDPLRLLKEREEGRGMEDYRSIGFM